MIAEHDRIVLTTDVPDDHLASGEVGAVVHVYADEAAYEVEFFTLDGHTAAVVTIDAAHVQPVSRAEILHARPLASRT
jgi:hypothetical protein